MQEVFLQVHKSLAEFRGQAKLSTWLHRVTVNVVLMVRRAARSRPVFAGDAVADQEPDSGSSGRGRGAPRAGRGVPAAARPAPGEEADGVRAARDRGARPGDIVRIVDAPVLTVSPRLFYARRELAEMMRTEPTPATAHGGAGRQPAAEAPEVSWKRRQREPDARRDPRAARDGGGVLRRSPCRGSPGMPSRGACSPASPTRRSPPIVATTRSPPASARPAAFRAPRASSRAPSSASSASPRRRPCWRWASDSIAGLGRDARGHGEGAPPASRPPAVAFEPGSVRVRDLSALRVGDVVEAGDAPVPLRPRRAGDVGDGARLRGARALHRSRWGRPPCPRPSPAKGASGVGYTVALERGAIRAEVTPRDPSEGLVEAFAVEVGGTRVAVHGTAFSVKIEGDRAIVDVEHGAVAVGPVGHVGATTGHLLVGPSRASFSLDGGRTARLLARAEVLVAAGDLDGAAAEATASEPTWRTIAGPAAPPVAVAEADAPASEPEIPQRACRAHPAAARGARVQREGGGPPRRRPARRRGASRAPAAQRRRRPGPPQPLRAPELRLRRERGLVTTPSPAPSTSTRTPTAASGAGG